jgi:hypothetical protein
MSAVFVSLAYLVISPFLLVPAWSERRRFWLVLTLLLAGLVLCEGIALGRQYAGLWRGLEFLFGPVGTWLLGPQGG